MNRHPRDPRQGTPPLSLRLWRSRYHRPLGDGVLRDPLAGRRGAGRANACRPPELLLSRWSLWRLGSLRGVPLGTPPGVSQKPSVLGLYHCREHGHQVAGVRCSPHGSDEPEYNKKQSSPALVRTMQRREPCLRAQMVSPMLPAYVARTFGKLDRPLCAYSVIPVVGHCFVVPSPGLRVDRI